MSTHTSPSIDKTVADIRSFYQQIDQAIQQLQTSSKISCLAGCDHCCRNPHIEVSIAEILPTAYQIYRNGHAEDVYQQLMKDPPTLCYFYDSKVNPRGSCQNYQDRPALCRMFGFAAVRDKNGRQRISTCRPIKQVHAEAIAAIEARLHSEDMEIPLLSHIQLRLQAIDARLDTKPRPINEALRLAIQWIAILFDYDQSVPDPHPEHEKEQPRIV